jgi:hypothetical protein
VINAAKVLFLRPRPQPRAPKGQAMPSRCVVDGRQLMDNGTLYCSIRWVGRGACAVDCVMYGVAGPCRSQHVLLLRGGRPAADGQWHALLQHQVGLGDCVHVV